MIPPAIRHYSFAIVVTVLTLIVDIIAAPWMRNGPLMLLVLPVVLAAWYGGIGPGLTAAFVAAVGANLFLMEPSGAFNLAPTPIVATLTLVTVGSLVGLLTGRARQGELAALRIGERLRVTLSSIGDGVIVTDNIGRVAFINPVAETIIKSRSDAVVGRPIDEVFPLISEVTGAVIENPVFQVLREGKLINLIDGTQLVRQDGTFLPISDTCSPIRDSNGVVEGAVLVFRDQTRIRETDQLRTYISAIVESSTDAIKGTALDGTITTWNAAAERLYGYTADEMIGTNNARIIPSSRPDELAALLEKIGRGEHIEQYETRRVRKDGRLIDVSIGVSPIRDHFDKVIGAATIARDISNQKQQERRQRLLADVAGVIDDAQLDLPVVLQSIAQFVSETLGDGALIQVATPDRAFLHPVALYDPDPEVRALWWEMVNAVPQRVGQGLSGTVFQTGEPILIPVLLLGDGGKSISPLHVPYLEKLRFQSVLMVPLRARGQVLGVLGISRHTGGEPYTTEDQALLQELANRAGMAIENARLYREAQESIEAQSRLNMELGQLARAEQQARAEAQFAAERATQLQRIGDALGSALTVNDVARTIVTQGFATLGVQAGGVTLVSGDHSTLTHVATVGYPDDVVETMRHLPVSTPIPIAEVILTGEPIWVESISDLKDRSPASEHIPTDIAFGAFVALPLNVGGRAIGSIGLHFAEEREFGVDDRLFMLAVAAQSAQALERARAYEAEQAAVRARDEFLAVAAHEIRTPITSMRGFAQLSLRRIQNDPTPDLKRLETAFEQIVQQSGRLNELVNRLLDISRIEAGKLVVESRPTDLGLLVSRVADQLQWTALGRIFDIRAPEGITAHIDPLRFEQVLVNLLDNALKFSPEASRIEIVVENRSKDSLGFIRVSVRDYGIGVPVEARSELFERFHQGHGKGHAGGMGLGLYLSRQIIELHGGRMSAEFPLDGGTRIIVEVPCENQSNGLPVFQADLGSAK